LFKKKIVGIKFTFLKKKSIQKEETQKKEENTYLLTIGVRH